MFFYIKLLIFVKSCHITLLAVILYYCILSIGKQKTTQSVAAPNQQFIVNKKMPDGISTPLPPILGGDSDWGLIFVLICNMIFL